MAYSISDHKRLNPKKESTFGKKPFKGKKRNRKGNTLKTFEHEPLNVNKPIRFKTPKYRQRQREIKSLGVCQVCELNYELDTPHHVMQGSCKDDRYLINICIDCHALIHMVGYSAALKDRLECKVIAWNNHLMFENK